MALLAIDGFVDYIVECWNANDGYIMCSVGEDPKTLSEWYFSQYRDNAAQYAKAQYWRENCKRVHDCQGMVDGYLTKILGKKINVRARDNYAGWCDIKGEGKIPNQYKTPGAAVFIHDGSYISHVGYLVYPVDENYPDGDWYVIEARGVMYGVVRTKLNSRGWNRWGLMTKYFLYDGIEVKDYESGERKLEKGCTGQDVKALQESLIALGFSCGKYGADGDFGNATDTAVRAFQTANELDPIDGIVGNATFAKINALLTDDGGDAPVSDAPPIVDPPNGYTVTGGSVWLWDGPGNRYNKITIVRKGDLLPTLEVGTYVPISHTGGVAWINSDYIE